MTTCTYILWSHLHFCLKLLNNTFNYTQVEQEPDMPPKKKQSSKGSDDRSNPSNECCVCCQDLNIAKDEALFCTGHCQQWLHRYCAGVSLPAYKHIKEKDCQFRCFACYQLFQQEEVTKLRNKVTRLSYLIDKFQPSSTLTTSSAPGSSNASAVGECGSNNTKKLYLYLLL